MVLASVDVDGAQGSGVDVATSLDCVSFTGVTVRDCSTGIACRGAARSTFRPRASDCGEGLVMLATRGVEMAGVHVLQCTSGIRVEGSWR